MSNRVKRIIPLTTQIILGVERLVIDESWVRLVHNPVKTRHRPFVVEMGPWSLSNMFLEYLEKVCPPGTNSYLPDENAIKGFQYIRAVNFFHIDDSQAEDYWQRQRKKQNE